MIIENGQPYSDNAVRRTGYDSTNDRVAILLSPHFPPSTVAGVHRSRHLAKHLPSVGWRAIVLCVDDACYEEHLDPSLGRLVPPNVDVIRTGAIPSRLTRRLGIGDIGLRAWYPLRRALFKLLATRPIDALLITGSPYFPMLLSRDVKRHFNVPVVLDFQDPWVSAWGASQATFSKAGLAHHLAVLLEPRALRAADFVTSVSDVQNAEMAARYPWLDGSRMAGIPIGCDREDFGFLNICNREVDPIELEPDLIHLSYVGTFLPRAGLLVRTLFRAFARLRAIDPGLAARIRLNFIGTSNQPADGQVPSIFPIAKSEGVTDAVREMPQRIPYLSALSVLVRSEGILLIGSDEPHYTASKIYPALMSGRPFLSLFHRASSAHAILSASGGGCVFAFEDHKELSTLEAQIAEGLRVLALGSKSVGRINSAAVAPFEAHNIAGRFGEIFDRLARKRNG